MYEASVSLKRLTPYCLQGLDQCKGNMFARWLSSQIFKATNQDPICLPISAAKMPKEYIWPILEKKMPQTEATFLELFILELYSYETVTDELWDLVVFT